MQQEAAIGACCRCGGGKSPCSHMFEFCQFGELHLMVCILLTAGSWVDHSNGRGLGRRGGGERRRGRARKDSSSSLLSRGEVRTGECRIFSTKLKVHCKPYKRVITLLHCRLIHQLTALRLEAWPWPCVEPESTVHALSTRNATPCADTTLHITTRDVGYYNPMARHTN